MVFIIAELKKDDIVTRSNSMAYSFFLSLFPSIIFMFTLLPYIPIDNFEMVIQQAIRNIMPENAHGFLFESIDSIMSIPHGGMLSIGFLLALIFASNGFDTLLQGFEKSYQVSFKRRNFFKKRLIALGLTVFVGFMFLISGVIIIAGNKILGLLFDQAATEGFNPYLFATIKWVSILVLFYGVISVIYKFGPPLKRKFGWVSPGTTLATVFCLLTSVGFSYFIDNFGTQSRIYGSLGALIVMLVWMQLNCFILLAGFELNASIAVNRDLLRKSK